MLYHITSPAEDGSGAAKAMEWAVKEAGISTDDVWYVNAHGTSTHHNDLFETIAIKKTFGEHAKEMKINFYLVIDKLCLNSINFWLSLSLK